MEIGNALLLGADYPEDVANGNGGCHQPEERAQNGIERQSNSQSEVEDEDGNDEQEDVGGYFHYADIVTVFGKEGVEPCA